MAPILDILPGLIPMAVLISISAFFSASEAALFSLRAGDRKSLAAGTPAQQLAAWLLEDPDRLLSAVLFWNLAVNILYFALASLVAMQLEADEQLPPSVAVSFTIGSLLALIFFSEMLPKSLAVLKARQVASLAGYPLAIAVRVVDPLMPTLRLITLLSRRLIWPGFQPEPYLELADLERAIELSTTDAHLVEQEQKVLRNILSLSEIRVDECMRPRGQLVTFRPPVTLDDLRERLPPSGYLLVTEEDSDEIAAAVELDRITDFRSPHLEYFAEPVAYVPWCITVADALQQMQSKERDVAVVVNEVGETMGVLTRRDILDVIFTSRPSRSQRLFNREPIQAVEPGLWQVSGITNLRQLEEHFDLELPDTHSVTVAGVLHESLQRLPQQGDQCDWGPFHFEVLDAPPDRHLLISLRRLEDGEEDE